jgi:hypothetical protein
MKSKIYLEQTENSFTNYFEEIIGFKVCMDSRISEDKKVVKLHNENTDTFDVSILLQNRLYFNGSNYGNNYIKICIPTEKFCVEIVRFFIESVKYKMMDILQSEKDNKKLDLIYEEIMEKNNMN